MRLKPSAVCLLAVLAGHAQISSAKAQSATERALRDEIVMDDGNNPEMAQAMQNARASLPGFLKLAQRPRPAMRAMAVKVAVRDKDQTEFFCISPFSKTRMGYVGLIDNEPRLVKSVKINGKIVFKETEIVDWMYVEHDRMYGNYTACALMKNETSEERESYRKEFGLDCSRY
jgi:uncharacterized protein YegJ (DUF2314 family)